MSRIEYVAFGALGLSLQVLAGCGGGEGACQTATYPPAPADAKSAVHVSAGCPAGSADGSADHPFPTIQEGVDHAMSGEAVLVAPGTYAENVSIAKPIKLIGAPADSDPDAAPVLVKAPAHFAITIAEGTQGVELSGLAVLDPIGAGVWVQKLAQATVESSRIEGAVPDAMGFGYGFLATDDGAFVLCRSKITGSHLAGVLVSGSKGEIGWSKISGNHGRGGIRVETSTGTVSIHDNELDGNDEAAIGAYSSDVSVVKNVITNTKSGGMMNIGDGVVVSRLKDAQKMYIGSAKATLSGNTIQGNGRVGVLFSAGALGSVDSNQITGNGFGSAFAAGLWAQAGAGGPSGDGLVITGNTVSGNQYVGIGLTSNARAKIAENTAVSDTKAAVVFLGASQPLIGDGIGVFDGSFAAITGNTLQGNGRFGLIFDAASKDCTVNGNTIGGSGQFGVVVQNQATAPDLSTDTLMGNMGGESKVVGMGEMPYGVQKAEFGTP
jgi:parallel beta-helix repeat protein